MLFKFQRNIEQVLLELRLRHGLLSISLLSKRYNRLANYI